MAKRPSHSMPADVADAIERRNLRADYDARPRYQRNDYLGWIAAAKAQATRERRLNRMLDELKSGGVYMGMRHVPSAKD